MNNGRGKEQRQQTQNNMKSSSERGSYFNNNTDNVPYNTMKVHRCSKVSTTLILLEVCFQTTNSNKSIEASVTPEIVQIGKCMYMKSNL